LPDGAGIEDRDRQEGVSRGTVGLVHGPAWGPLSMERGGRWCLAEPAFPGVEGRWADSRSPAELCDRESGLLLAFNLSAPPLAPRFPIDRRSESNHSGCPRARYVGSWSRLPLAPRMVRLSAYVGVLVGLV
jgi:hypothetical protein